MDKIRSAHLHQAITIPGTKISGVMSLVPEKFPGITLEESPIGLIVRLNNVKAKIPWPNIAVTIYEKEDKADKSAKAA